MIKNMLLPPSLRKWILKLAENFSVPQKAHLLTLLMGILFNPGTLTLEMARRISGFSSSLSALSRFLDTDQWERDDLWLPVRNGMLREAIRRASRRPRRMRARWRKKKGGKKKRLPPRRIQVFISIDDTLIEKPTASQHFEGFWWHWDHTQRKMVWALCLITVNVRIGEHAFPGGFEIFLPRKAVAQLRRKYPDLSFRKKTDLGLMLLQSLEGLFPRDRFCVNVVMDSYYSSAKILNYCSAQGYTVVAGIKKNRRLDGKRVDSHARTLEHRAWHRIRVSNASGTRTSSYQVALLRGHLNEVHGRASVVISRRGRRDSSPEYFYSNSTTLSAREILARYAKRWQVELDYFFLKERLGLGDFRIRSLGGIMRYITIIMVAFCWLVHYHWSLADTRKETSAFFGQTIRHARKELAHRRVMVAYRMLQQNYSLTSITGKLFTYAA